MVCISFIGFLLSVVCCVVWALKSARSPFDVNHCIFCIFRHLFLLEFFFWFAFLCIVWILPTCVRCSYICFVCVIPCSCLHSSSPWVTCFLSSYVGCLTTCVLSFLQPGLLRSPKLLSQWLWVWVPREKKPSMLSRCAVVMWIWQRRSFLLENTAAGKLDIGHWMFGNWWQMCLGIHYGVALFDIVSLICENRWRIDLEASKFVKQQGAKGWPEMRGRGNECDTTHPLLLFFTNFACFAIWTLRAATILIHLAQQQQTWYARTRTRFIVVGCCS